MWLAEPQITPGGSEQVFATDKREAEEVGGSEAVSRIKKDLLQEIQALQPADRVVVIGCTNETLNCTKKDSESLLAAFEKHFYIPLPDYATRQACPLSLVKLSRDAQHLLACIQWIACTVGLGTRHT